MSHVPTILKADAARRVTLEGVGPVPRPVDIDQAQTGFEALRTLRIYRFAAPGVIHGHAEEDEVLIVILSGEVRLRIRSELWARSEEHFILAAAGASAPVACAAYLPPQAEYELTPLSDADVAYVRALPAAGRSPAIFSSAPRGHRGDAVLLLEESSHAERLRLRLLHLQTGDSAADLIAGDMPVSAGEALIHVRTAPAQSATVDGHGLRAAALDSWDTLAVAPNEAPRIRIGARSSAVGLVVSAA